MRPELFHYSNKPLTNAHSVKQTEKQLGMFGKPGGLWVSVDGEDDWPNWCRNQDFSVELLERRFRIVLKDPESLLWITTPQELLGFTERFGKTLFGLNEVDIDWITVAQSYPGVAIAPYQWSLRLDRRTRWYYGWDCASGCIWDAKVIERVEEVK